MLSRPTRYVPLLLLQMVAQKCTSRIRQTILLFYDCGISIWRFQGCLCFWPHWVLRKQEVYRRTEVGFHDCQRNFLCVLLPFYQNLLPLFSDVSKNRRESESQRSRIQHCYTEGDQLPSNHVSMKMERWLSLQTERNVYSVYCTRYRIKLSCR